MVRRPADLPLPGATSVVGVKDVSLSPDDPTASVVDEPDVNQFVLRSTFLTPPGFPAVFGMQNSAGVADDPALLLVREGQAVKDRHIAASGPGIDHQLMDQFPILSAVHRLQ